METRFLSLIATFPSLSHCFSEMSLHRVDFRDEVCQCIRESLLWTVVRGRLHSEDKLVLQGVWYLVPCKEDLGVPQQLTGGREGRGVSELVMNREALTA